MVLTICDTALRTGTPMKLKQSGTCLLRVCARQLPALVDERALRARALRVAQPIKGSAKAIRSKPGRGSRPAGTSGRLGGLLLESNSFIAPRCSCSFLNLCLPCAPSHDSHLAGTAGRRSIFLGPFPRCNLTANIQFATMMEIRSRMSLPPLSASRGETIAKAEVAPLRALASVGVRVPIRA